MHVYDIVRIISLNISSSRITCPVIPNCFSTFRTALGNMNKRCFVNNNDIPKWGRKSICSHILLHFLNAHRIIYAPCLTSCRNVSAVIGSACRCRPKHTSRRRRGVHSGWLLLWRVIYVCGCVNVSAEIAPLQFFGTYSTNSANRRRGCVALTRREKNTFMLYMITFSNASNHQSTIARLLGNIQTLAPSHQLNVWVCMVEEWL